VQSLTKSWNNTCVSCLVSDTYPAMREIVEAKLFHAAPCMFHIYVAHILCYEVLVSVQLLTDALVDG
jgi:hypothetical protein